MIDAMESITGFKVKLFMLNVAEEYRQSIIRAGVDQVLKLLALGKPVQVGTPDDPGGQFIVALKTVGLTVTEHVTDSDFTTWYRVTTR